MGFNSVYGVLQELFPQVDSRLLKAVALDHPKDADTAAEVVLCEMIPDLPQQPLTVGSPSNAQSSLGLFDDDDKTGKVESTVDHVVVNPCIAELSTEALDAGLSAQLTSHTAVEPVNSETKANPDGINVESDSPNLICENDIYKTNLVTTQDSDPSCSSKAFEKDNSAANFVKSDDESSMSSVLTRSEQICSTGYLDEVIEDAKNNKKALELAMDSVIDFMKAVESKEEAAEQAKEDAKRGCHDIVNKVDEVKHALLRAKEANDMHAGEVNAEKAILATELRELQHRLFTLSDERSRSLEILDEMRKALEIRMATALEEIAAAEDEKLEREQSAREALLYQENQMEKVVEESKKLKLEAEENSKLQEFLKDRGHTVDILQGEIAVKCQDVLLLKEKFDKRIPLSRSLFSSKKSSNWASSSSSIRSTTTLEPETVCLINCEEKKVDQLKGLLDDDDDGWELFNNGELVRC